MAYFAEEKVDTRNYLQRYFDRDPYETEEEADAALDQLRDELEKHKKFRKAHFKKTGERLPPRYILNNNYYGPYAEYMATKVEPKAYR